MNLFLLAAVPLAAVILHRILHPARPAFDRPQAWMEGGVWAVGSLVVASFFGRLRVFTGDLGGIFLGLSLTDVLLVPGIIVAAWVLQRKHRDPWELALWLTLVFTMAGIRDFAGTDKTYDLNELFLVPLQRILLIASLPALVNWALGAVKPADLALRVAAALGMALTGPLFQTLSFANAGWTVWILIAGSTVLSVWIQLPKKEAAPEGAASSIKPE